jgi:hypothetical protein
VERLNINLWLVVGVLFLIVSVVAVYKVWPLLYPESVEQAALDPNCDLRAGPCTSTLPSGGKVSFGIEPREIPLVKPLQLKVTVEGREVKNAEIDFVGVDMNMGYNRPKLAAQGGGAFTGDGILPVCVRDAMEWEARVMLNTDSGLVSAPFRFITVKSGVLSE